MGRGSIIAPQVPCANWCHIWNTEEHTWIHDFQKKKSNSWTIASCYPWTIASMFQCALYDSLFCGFCSCLGNLYSWLCESLTINLFWFASDYSCIFGRLLYLSRQQPASFMERDLTTLKNSAATESLRIVERHYFPVHIPRCSHLSFIIMFFFNKPHFGTEDLRLENPTFFAISPLLN